jgi:hypothetical protein
MLRYSSTSRVRRAQVRAILAEAASIERAWWHGGIGFDADDGTAPTVLAGATPLFHRSGVADEDDLFLAFADAALILERLADWARRFTLKWSLRMHDEDWGAIDPSGPTGPLLEAMGKWARRVGAAPAGKGRWRIDEGRRAVLLERYAGRP